MINIVSDVLSEFEYNHQKYVDKPDQVVYRLGMGLENGKSDCFIDIRPEIKLIMIYATFSINVPENKRMQISEYLTRANYGMKLGNFELDFSDGELRYKCAYLFEESNPAVGQVFASNFHTALRMLDKYIPGIMAVIYANVSPQSAICQVEDVIDPTTN